MSRIQRLGIGNGGMDCEISYMQGKKYPNAGDIVKPVQGVSNRTLLKNPYNTLNEPIANPGARPVRITTDNKGNVFARSETMLVPGVTNDTLLKNPNNIKSVAVGEKRTLSLQRIKDINNKMLPSYITENKGINEVMLQILTMIENKQVKLITIQLLKMLITKNVPQNSAHTEQKVLKALNYFDIVLTAGRRVFKENTLSPTKIPDSLRPSVNTYIEDIVKLYGINPNANPPNIDTDIQTGLSELGLLSNALTRMFEFNNSVDPSNTLTRDQISAAAYSGFGQQALPPQLPQPGGPQLPQTGGPELPPQTSGPELPQTGGPGLLPQPDEEKNPFSISRVVNFREGTKPLYTFIDEDADEYDLQGLKLFGEMVERYYQTITGPKHATYDEDVKFNMEMLDQLLSLNAENNIRVLVDIEALKNIPLSTINNGIGVRYRKIEMDGMINKIEKYVTDMIFFFKQLRPQQEVVQQPIPGEGRKHRRPQNSKVVFQVGKQAVYRRY